MDNPLLNLSSAILGNHRSWSSTRRWLQESKCPFDSTIEIFQKLFWMTEKKIILERPFNWPIELTMSGSKHWTNNEWIKTWNYMNEGVVCPNLQL